MDIKKIEINKLIPALYNPRKDLKPDDAEYKKIKRSIEQFGYVEPVIWNKRTGNIVGGHQRYKILKDLGYKEVDCVVVDLDENNEKALNVALNKISGEWDFELLGSLLEELKLDDFDVTLTGFELDDIEGLLNIDEPKEVEEDDFDADEALENIKEPMSKRGDIWLLGKHRLMNGDSTSVEDISVLMDGKKADMVFTDPPYGMFLDADYSGMNSKFKGSTGGNKYNKVIGDNEDFKPELIKTVFDNFGYCKEIFLWGADYYSELLEDKNNGSWVVWDKRLDDSADKMFGSTFELCWSKAKHKRMIARVKWAGIFGLEKEFDKKRQHPTQKPIQLIAWFFDYYSLQDKVRVVDLYGGSGSTLITGEKYNKEVFTMELDEKYCDVIVNRYINYKNSSEDVFLIREGKKIPYKDLI